MNLEESKMLVSRISEPRVALILEYLYEIKDVKSDESLERIVRTIVQTAVIAGIAEYMSAQDSMATYMRERSHG